ncbi:MAG: PP2C family protein-serine/threonine phosphatase [Candidatus Babeliales bacterium]|nr:PP2C family protein-serine/threonine phosphatase [Candidatus Babeliales bacterium]
MFLKKLFIYSLLCLGLSAADIKYGVISDNGGKPFMQDRYRVNINKSQIFFGVFDGHGSNEDGHMVAELVSSRIYRNIVKDNIYFKANKILQAIVLGFQKTNDELPDYQEIKKNGSTGSVVLIKNNRLYYGYVGDSKIVVASKNSYSESIDHKMIGNGDSFSDEYHRIKALAIKNEIDYSYFIKESRSKENFFRLTVPWSSKRLAMTRSFGDKELHPYLISEPDVHSIFINDAEFVIIASDGLWDVVSASEAINIVERENIHVHKINCKIAAVKLVKLALQRWQAHSSKADNITVMVIDLKQFHKNKVKDLISNE